MVTVSIDCDLISKSIGSETARAPVGIKNEGLPPKATVLRVPGTMVLTPAEPLYGKATVTAVTGRSFVPNAFDTRILICFAPIDMCSVCRIVALRRTPVELF